MSKKWEPENFEEDAVANAIMNLAAEMNFVGQGVHDLLYGLKYGRETGMSIAEALEVGADRISSALGSIELGHGE